MAVIVFDPQSVQVRGDLVTATAAVDGQPYTVTCWLSHLNGLPNAAARRTYLAGLLKAAAQPPAPQTVDLSGTVTV